MENSIICLIGIFFAVFGVIYYKKYKTTKNIVTIEKNITKKDLQIEQIVDKIQDLDNVNKQIDNNIQNHNSVKQIDNANNAIEYMNDFNKRH